MTSTTFVQCKRITPHAFRRHAATPTKCETLNLLYGMFLLRSIIIPNLSVVSQMVHAYHRKHKHINKLNLKNNTKEFVGTPDISVILWLSKSSFTSVKCTYRPIALYRLAHRSTYTQPLTIGDTTALIYFNWNVVLEAVCYSHTHQQSQYVMYAHPVRILCLSCICNASLCERAKKRG